MKSTAFFILREILNRNKFDNKMVFSANNRVISFNFFFSKVGQLLVQLYDPLRS